MIKTTSFNDSFKWIWCNRFFINGKGERVFSEFNCLGCKFFLTRTTYVKNCNDPVGDISLTGFPSRL